MRLWLHAYSDPEHQDYLASFCSHEVDSYTGALSQVLEEASNLLGPSSYFYEIKSEDEDEDMVL